MVCSCNKRDDTRPALTVFTSHGLGQPAKKRKPGGSSLRVTVSRLNRGRGPPMALCLPRGRSAARWTAKSKENSIGGRGRGTTSSSHRVVSLRGGSRTSLHSASTAVMVHALLTTIRQTQLPQTPPAVLFVGRSSFRSIRCYSSCAAPSDASSGRVITATLQRCIRPHR